jgi:hypothetical protein
MGFGSLDEEDEEAQGRVHPDLDEEAAAAAAFGSLDEFPTPAPSPSPLAPQPQFPLSPVVPPASGALPKPGKLLTSSGGAPGKHPALPFGGPDDQFNWRENYYKEKFGRPVDAAERRALATTYAHGLMWVLNYYHFGVCSWAWFFPYHHPPLAEGEYPACCAFLFGR